MGQTYSSKISPTPSFPNPAKRGRAFTEVISWAAFYEIINYGLTDNFDGESAKIKIDPKSCVPYGWVGSIPTAGTIFFQVIPSAMGVSPNRFITWSLPGGKTTDIRQRFPYGSRGSIFSTPGGTTARVSFLL
jgi:hypothetical protein